MISRASKGARLSEGNEHEFAKVAAFAAFFFAPALAQAHPGFHPEGFAAGVLHPFTGVDHLLAMTAVGFWAATLGGRARFLVPAAFILLMIAGAVLGLNGVPVPGVEQGIAASVVVLGLVIAFQLRIPTLFAALLVGVFAIFHGHAHGAELPEATDPVSFAIGFVLATAILHGIGLGAGLLAPMANRRLFGRLAGGAIASCGFVLAYLAA